jgi:hypothetical protein
VTLCKRYCLQQLRIFKALVNPKRQWLCPLRIDTVEVGCPWCSLVISGKIDNLKRSEIGPSENIFEVFAPRKSLNQLWRLVNEFIVFDPEFIVHDRSEAWKKSSGQLGAKGLSVCVVPSHSSRQP